jgi:hypothetical protein
VGEKRIILEWLEVQKNFQAFNGGNGSKEGGSLRKSDAYRNIADEINKKQRRLIEAGTARSWKAKDVKNRFATMLKNYKALKKKASQTGWGVTKEDKNRGNNTVKEKLEALFPFYERFDRLFGSRPNVVPVLLQELNPVPQVHGNPRRQSSSSTELFAPISNTGTISNSTVIVDAPNEAREHRGDDDGWDDDVAGRWLNDIDGTDETLRGVRGANDAGEKGKSDGSDAAELRQMSRGRISRASDDGSRASAVQAVLEVDDSADDKRSADFKPKPNQPSMEGDVDLPRAHPEAAMQHHAGIGRRKGARVPFDALIESEEKRLREEKTLAAADLAFRRESAREDLELRKALAQLDRERMEANIALENRKLQIETAKVESDKEKVVVRAKADILQKLLEQGKSAAEIDSVMKHLM